MNLEEARSALEEIDREIVLLIARRQDYSSVIAAEKIKSGSSVRDRAQKEKVIRRAAALAEEAGLDEADIIRVFELLIEMNEKAQEKYI